MSVIVSNENKQRLYDLYNATSTETEEGSDELETYENWLERQLLSRMEKLDIVRATLPTDVEILIKSSQGDVYVNDEQRIGYQKGVKWLREMIKNTRL